MPMLEPQSPQVNKPKAPLPKAPAKLPPAQQPAPQQAQSGGYAQQQAQNKPAPIANLGVPGQAGKGTETLPDTLQNLPSGKKVAHGTDAGNFYCEHMFYSTQNAAKKPGSTVVKNAEGESLTGFLHLPGDQQATNDPGESYQRAQSEKDTSAVVGSALRGWIDTALPKAGSGPVKMLLTGYANWGSVVDNPTGAFVSHQANLDAAMLKAYGKTGLATPKGTVVDQSLGPKSVYKTWKYQIRVGGKLREVLLRGQVFPVADETINSGPQSVQAAMAEFGPHGVLSMGVAVGREDFLAEHHADDGGLDKTGKKHEDGAQPRKNMPDNYALARGIVDGQKGNV